MSDESAAAQALQEAWDSIETLPPIIFTDAEAAALIAALRAALGDAFSSSEGA